MFLLLSIHGIVSVILKIFTSESVKYILGNLSPRNNIQNLYVETNL